jgi:hypothetical protein
MIKSYNVDVRIANLGNHELRLIRGLVRNLSDSLGKPGIVAKKGTANKKLKQSYHMIFRFAHRYYAEQFIARIQEFLSNMVQAVRKYLLCKSHATFRD